MPLHVVGTLVWEKWRSDWYMGQIVDVEGAVSSALEDNDLQSRSIPVRVKIHIHGEPDTRDKWHELTSSNIVELVEIDSEETAVGVFPQAGDVVELLVIDAPLVRAASRRDEQLGLLVGTVLRVFPARDASLVEVQYPLAQPLTPSGSRRVCVGNGYIRVHRKSPHVGAMSLSTSEAS